MAAIPVTINGLLFKADKSVEKVCIIGLQSITGLQIGGGPIIPETPPEVTPPDLGFWEDPGGYNPDAPGMPWPPEVEPPIPPSIEWKAAWTEETGWVVIGIPTGEHPTPSSKKSK